MTARAYYRGHGWFKALSYPEILWSSSLAQTGSTRSPALHQAVIHIDQWLTQEAWSEFPQQLVPVAELLVEQGFLSKSPIEKPVFSEHKIPHKGWPVETVRIWHAFHFETMACCSNEATLHFFENDGQGRAWAYLHEPNRTPCLECLVRRWFSNANLGDYWRSLLDCPVPIFWTNHNLAADWTQLDYSAQSGAENSLWLFDPKTLWQPQSLQKSPHCLRADCPNRLPKLHALRPGPFALISSTKYWTGFGPGDQPNSSNQAPELDLHQELLINHPFIATASTGDVQLLATDHTPGGRRWRGSGAWWDVDLAMKSAVGEALERYCASQPHSLHRAAWQISDIEWVPKRYLKSQALDNPCPGLELDWVWGKRLRSSGGHSIDSQVRLAAQQVFLAPFDGPQVDPGLSHGLACGNTIEDCLLGGIWELIERDAVAQFWGRLLLGRRDAFQSISHRLSIEGSKLYLYALPALCGRAILALAEVDGKPVFGSAAGAGGGKRPVLKAISECLHNRAYLERHLPDAPRVNPQSFDQHLSYYWHHPDQFPWHQFKDCSNSVSFETILNQNPEAASVESLLGELSQQGVQLAYIDLTTADVEQMGKHVVRVLAPQLLSIPERHDSWPLGLKRWSSQVGSKKAPALPHPFG